MRRGLETPIPILNLIELGWDVARRIFFTLSLLLTLGRVPRLTAGSNIVSLKSFTSWRTPGFLAL